MKTVQLTRGLLKGLVLEAISSIEDAIYDNNEMPGFRTGIVEDQLVDVIDSLGDIADTVSLDANTQKKVSMAYMLCNAALEVLKTGTLPNYIHVDE